MVKKDSKQKPNLKLNKLMFGFAVGKVCAIMIFIMTIVGIYNPNYAQIWHTFTLQIYGFLGYKLTWPGAILGAIYGFIDGFILGWLIAFFYNKNWCLLFKK
jgi:hypothetical protein